MLDAAVIKFKALAFRNVNKFTVRAPIHLYLCTSVLWFSARHTTGQIVLRNNCRMQKNKKFTSGITLK